MKKTARNIVLIVVAVLLIAALVVAGVFFLPGLLGGNQSNAASGTLQVNTIKIMPYAYMGESFDLRDVLLMEEGVEYSATACYVDIATMTEYSLEVNDLCFTPEVVAETVVVLTAKRGSETASKVIYIPTTIRAEPLDDLYKSSGPLGGADPGISKTVNIDPLYLKGEKSTTSLHVSFNSTDPHPYGNSFMNFSSAEAQQYFTDQVWENAIVTFWVYNPNEEAIEFQFRQVDDEGKVNADWQTVDGPHKQRAEPGQWTQLFWSLRKLGTTRRLTGGKFVNDLLLLKFRYDAYSTTEAYSFDFYIDDVDVVDGSAYPEIDTKYVRSNEEIEQGWENMKMDTGWQGAYVEYDYDNIMGENSNCSAKVTFPGEKGKTNSFVCLSPESQFEEDPDMTGGILSGYFKFENMEKKVSLDILNKKWETSNKVDFKLTPVGDDWYYGEIDLEDIEVGSGRNDNIIRIRLHFYGVNDDSVVYIDSLNYEYKYVEKVLEEASVDLINMSADTGAYYMNVTKSFVTSHLKGSNTVRSLKLVAPANTTGRYTWNTSSAYTSKQISYKFDMTSGTLGAWFYFGNQLPNANITITNAAWKGSTPVDFVFTQNTNDGWYYGELHASDIKCPEGGGTSEAIRITIQIPAGYTVYIDNLSWKPGVENTLTAAEINPDVLFDGGDLLADTNTISHNKTHWENVVNTDDFNKDGVIDPDVTTGLTCGVDTTNVTGQYSVRSWYFKAAAANAFQDATAQLQFAKAYDFTGKNLSFDIKIDTESKVQQTIGIRLHNSNWGNLNDTNKVIKLNPGDWRHVVVNFDDVLKEDAKLNDLKMITFYFDFFANTGKERTIYIDNVRLTTDAATGNETPLPLGPEDQFDGGDLLAGTDKLTYNKNHWENVENTDDFDKDGVVDPDVTSGLTCGVNTDKANLNGQYSVRSWYFKAAAANNFGNAVAQLQLAQSYDMTGKNLAFDIRIDSESKVQQTVGVRLQTSGWSNINEQNVTVKLNADETWKTVVMDFSDVVLENADLTQLGFISFYFDFAANTGKDRAIYIDNVRLTTDAATGNDVPFELGPEDQFDGGDLLAGTDNLTYNKIHWENVVNTDDFDKDGNVDPDVTAGLTCGVNTDKANLNGQYSVRSWYFKAAAANAFTDATAQLQLAQSYDMTGKKLSFDIRIDSASKIQQSVSVRLHYGWSNINDTPVSIKLNADETWKTVVLDFSNVLTEKADLTKLSMITFYFDFAANTGKDRAIYIDNVKLVDASTATSADDIPEELEPADMYDGGDLLANATAADNTGFFGNSIFSYDANSTNVYKGNGVGEYSVKSWKFSALPAENGDDMWPTALLNLGRSVNMNGKILAMDVFIENANASLSIYTIHNSSWGRLNESENSANYRNETIAGQWVTLYYDLASKVAEGKDLSDVKFIKFQFSFKGQVDLAQNVYIDNVRLVNASDVPAADDVDLDWTNMTQDKGAASYHNTVTNEFSAAHVKGENSIKSLHIVAPADADGRFTLHTEIAVSRGELEKLPNMTAGTLGAWFYFGEQTPAASLRVTEKAWNESAIVDFTFGEGQDGWYYGTVDCTKLTYQRAFYPGLTIRATVFIPAGYDVYIDSMTFQAADIPDPVEPGEDPGDLLGSVKSLEFNGAHWTHETGLTVKPNTEKLYTAETASTRSMSFLATAAANMDRATAQFKLPESVDMTGYNLAFDVFYDADTKLQQKIQLRLHSSNGNINDIDESVRINAGAWKTVVVNFDDVINDGMDYSDLKMITFYFDFANNTGIDRAVYIDNVRLTTAGETEDDVQLPLDPSELYDGGDLLAKATVEWNPDLWDGDPAAVESNSSEIYNTGDVGEFSVKSWKFYTTKDNFSEGIQLKLNNTFDLTGKDIVMDVKFVNATQVIGIELFNNWNKLQPDGVSIATVNGDGSDGWQTLTIPYGALIEELGNQDHSSIALIRFKFDFTSEAAGEHAVYIDNLRFVKSNYYEVSSDLLGAATVEAPDWTEGNGLTVAQTADSVNGSLSEQSWSFKATAAVNADASVLFDFGENLDMNGKYLFFDAKTSAEQNITVKLYDEAKQELTTDGVCVVKGSDWTDVGVVLANIANSADGLSAVRYISFSFDYSSNAGADREAYIDNVRLVSGESVANDWIHIQMSDDSVFCNVEKNLTDSAVKAENSTVSLRVTAPVDAAGIFTLDIANGYAGTMKHRGTLAGWFYFDDQTPSATVSIVEAGGNATVETMAFTFGENVNGWYYGSVDLSKAVYAEGVNRAYITKISVSIPQASQVLIDGLNYTDITETVADDMINLSNAVASGSGSYGYSTDVVYDDNSVHSLQANMPIGVNFIPEEALDLTNGTFSCWLYFGESGPSDALVRFAFYSGASSTGYVTMNIAATGENGWYQATLDTSTVAENKQAILASVDKILIQFMRQSTYMDYLTFEPNVPVSE